MDERSMFNLAKFKTNLHERKGQGFDEFFLGFCNCIKFVHSQATLWIKSWNFVCELGDEVGMISSMKDHINRRRCSASYKDFTQDKLSKNRNQPK